MSTTTPGQTAPQEPSGPVTASVHTGGSSSTLSGDSDSITFRMGKQSLAILIGSLLAASGVGGGVVSGVSDRKLDERVSAALGESLDKRLSTKFAEMQAAATSAAAAASDKSNSELKEILYKQGANAEASQRLESATRASTTTMLADHEERLRFLERAASAGRR